MIERMKTKNFINDEMDGVFDEIFEKIDQDGDGKIDYDEWVGAMSNKVELLNDENLKILQGIFNCIYHSSSAVLYQCIALTPS